MKNLFVPKTTRLTRLILGGALLACGAVGMFAQAAPASQDVQAMLAEIRELKGRLAAVEAKLDSYQAAAAVPAARPVESQPSTPAPNGPSVSAAEHPAAKAAPFAFGDFTWMNGQSRQKSQPLSNSFATVNLYLDTYYGYSFNQPRDDTIIGSGAVGRNTEWQINNATIGIDTNYKNVIGKITLQAGNQLAVTQDLDGTVNRGRNLTVANNKYIGEALGGYHFDRWNGINVEAGYFYSYIGLESYLLGENWNYNRSFLSDLTPFYFSGARIQIFPTDKIKIEPWFMNGYQTYGKWSKNNSIGLSNYWRPKESLGFVANFYYGTDTKDDPHRKRFHHDDSILVRYFNRPQSAGYLEDGAESQHPFRKPVGRREPVSGTQRVHAGIVLCKPHLVQPRSPGVVVPGRGRDEPRPLPCLSTDARRIPARTRQLQPQAVGSHVYV